MHSVEVKEVPIADFEIDYGFQRPLIRSKVERMKGKFNPAALGFVEAWQRDDGSLVLIDGQHRIQLLRELNDPAYQIVTCKVHTGINRARAADLYLTLNDTTKPKVVQQFLAGLVAGYETEVTITKIVKEFGFDIAPYSNATTFSCVDALKRIYNGDRRVSTEKHVEELNKTLATIVDAWRHQEPVSGEVVYGIGLFFLRYTDFNLDTKSLAHKLALEGPPDILLGKARQFRALKGTGKVAYHVSTIVRDTYNKGRSTRRLPE